MPSEKDGVMIILSSPSGAGKTTLVKKLSEKDNFEISISHTTRQPRPSENQQRDYFFVDEIEFKRLIQNQEFLEYAKVFNNFYGTTRTPVIDKLNRAKNIYKDFDFYGYTKEYLNEGIEQYNDFINYHFNLEFNGRTTNDDIYDLSLIHISEPTRRM